MEILFRRKSSHGDYGGVHKFSPVTIINAAKVCVCEQLDLDPRKIMLFRDGEVLIPIKRWAEKGFKGKSQQSFDPTRSFRDNNIKEEELFWLVDNPSGYALCPICMEYMKPGFPSGFDCLSMRFHCPNCDWHWDVIMYENGMIQVEDEMVHVILRAPFGTVQRDVPSNMKVEQVVESIVRQSCGIRAEIKGRVVLPRGIWNASSISWVAVQGLWWHRAQKEII